MRLFSLLLATLVTLPALAFEGGAGSYQIDGYDDYMARQDTSHVSLCMKRIENEATQRMTRISSMTGTSVPSNGQMVLGAIAELENGAHCECAWNVETVICN
jgi:hypothetical protein